MSDPTQIVITASFAAAVGIFTATAVLRKLSRKEEPVVEPLEEIADLSPYLTPVAVPQSTDPVAEKVPTWFFNPLDLIGLAVICLLFFGAVVGSLGAAEDPDATLNPQALIATIGVQFVAAGLVSSLVVTRVRASEWLGLKWRQWPSVFLIAPGGVIVMWLFFTMLTHFGYMEWVESFGVDGVQDSVRLLQESTDPQTLALMVVAAVLAAPICEEIVFRGYLYGATKRFAGPWAAGICSALIFAAVHGSLAALLPLFVFGCVLVFVYEKTGSIWAPMAVHFCFNGATVLVQLAARYYHLPLEPSL